jgi:hypothetical protein
MMSPIELSLITSIFAIAAKSIQISEERQKYKFSEDTQ